MEREEVYLISIVLSLYLDESRGVQGKTSMWSRQFLRAQPEGTPETECWYFLYYPAPVKVQTGYLVSRQFDFWQTV